VTGMVGVLGQGRGGRGRQNGGGDKGKGSVHECCPPDNDRSIPFSFIM
jgi:hypothetical protein